MLAVQNEPDRVLLELTYSDEGKLDNLLWCRVSLEGLPNLEVERLRRAGGAVRERRLLSATQARGKIRPNEQCPCGSGKKYKRCCRP